MRDLKAVKDMRDSLRNDFAKLMDAKNEMNKLGGFIDMNEYDKKKFGYLLTTISKLNIQINALTFVLNEDTEIFDATDDVMYDTNYGINKHSIMSDIGRDW